MATDHSQKLLPAKKLISSMRINMVCNQEVMDWIASKVMAS